jgi:glutathione S-transferase
MITIYHVPRTRSMRVIWLCEELGQPYEVLHVPFSAEYRSTDEWRKLSPTGKVPAMADSASEGGAMTMFESGAMVQYILTRYGNGRLEPKAGTADHAHYLQWCWFAEATLARPVGDMVHHTILKPEAERIPAVVVDAEKKARSCLAAYEDAITDKTYLLGDSFTAADIMTGYSLMLARRVGAFDDAYPKLNEYYQRLESRPGFQVSMAPAPA